MNSREMESMLNLMVAEWGVAGVVDSLADVLGDTAARSEMQHVKEKCIEWNVALVKLATEGPPRMTHKQPRGGL